jgi:hypothetical protein
MLFFGKHREGAGFLLGAASLPNRSIGSFEKNLQKFWKIRNLSGTAAATVHLASHQYGLQIAEGMVTFFESYERQLEKYRTKTLFFQLS